MTKSILVLMNPKELEILPVKVPGGTKVIISRPLQAGKKKKTT